MFINQSLTPSSDACLVAMRIIGIRRCPAGIYRFNVGTSETKCVHFTSFDILNSMFSYRYVRKIYTVLLLSARLQHTVCTLASQGERSHGERKKKNYNLTIFYDYCKNTNQVLSRTNLQT